MRRIDLRLILAFAFAALGVSLAGAALAHRSGCHSWHSCPSDTGSYVCGDKGYCSQCPNNKYCQDKKPKKLKR